MFHDIRSKKVVLIAHCLINQNAISDGTAVYPAAFNDLITLLMQNNIGIVQMPCPELCCLGLDRGNPSGADSPVLVENTRIRSAMQQKEPNEKLQKLIDYVMLQICEYQKHGFKIMAIIGANPAPPTAESIPLRKIMKKYPEWDYSWLELPSNLKKKQ